jgi:cytochrome c oxidase subunit II
LLHAAATVLAAPGQSVLKPESHAAREITHLWWAMLIGSGIGFAVVVGLLLLGWFRRSQSRLPFGGGERAATRFVVGLGIAVPIVVLTLLFVWSDIFVIRSTAAPKPGTTELTVDVIGKQWFWEVRYPGSGVVTANELHIPVGVRVRVVGTTEDVIHSFWVPELNKKIDLIPGRRNVELLDAERPGVYRGQCAEFCGLQHAHMSFLVFADPPARFRAWLAAQSRTAAPRRGFRLFTAEQCASCHTIRGTSARGRVGPDLTHVRSRTTLAAATIPNDPASLAAWLRDPQHVKPGNRMPDLELSAQDVRALVAYLDGLR